MSTRHFEYRPEIDGLRAIAIVLVILYHVGLPGITGGFVGVDVFFVISGYLITSLLFIEAEDTGRISLRDFYARRVRRLFPALMIVVLATLVAGAFLLLPTFAEQTGLAKSAIATSLYLSNVYFWKYTGGYFDIPTEFEPLLHTWSLAVEEQFYLFWPVLLIVLLKLRGNRAVGTLARDMLLLLVAGTILSFLFGWWNTPRHPTAAYYLMPSRAWEFGVGGITALFLLRKPQPSPVAGTLLALLGIGAMVGSALMLTRASPFPGVNALIPTLGTCAAIVGCAMHPRSFVTRALTFRPMIVIGLLSYSWYLWHWPLLAIARTLRVARFDLRTDLLLGAASLGLAALTYVLVENPVRRKRPGPFATTPKTLATGVAISVFLAASAGALGAATKYLWSDNPRYLTLDQAKGDAPPLRDQCNHPYAGPFQGLPPRGPCVLGDPHDIAVVLWGDSHADHLSGLAQGFARKYPGPGILQRTFSSCHSAYDLGDSIDAAALACKDFNRAVEAEILALQPQGLKGVIISNMWNTIFSGELIDTMIEQRRLRAEDVDAFFASRIANIEALVTRLEQRGLRVLLVAPTPMMPHSVPECLARHAIDDCSPSRESADFERHNAMEVLNGLQQRHPHSVRVWDPLQTLCENARACYAQLASTVMFTDYIHFTAGGGRLLTDAASDSLLWVSGRDPVVVSKSD